MTMDIRRELLQSAAERSPLSVTTWPPSSTSGYQAAMMPTTISPTKQQAIEGRGLWTPIEHERFVRGIKIFPTGPWKDIAAHVGTRTARQTMTHAQKYRQKVARRLRNAQVNAQHRLPFGLDASSSRYSALLSNDEQLNDSILSTALAIAAEKDLDMMEELTGATSPVITTPVLNNIYAASAMRTSEHVGGMADDVVGMRHDEGDLAFEECIDFLIAKFHDDEHLFP